MSENREYKSDVFSMLMEDKANALQVYNLLNGSEYDDPEVIETVNLEKIVSLSVSNDSAFIVGTDISIYEHQSSYNPNMPLRSLVYYASIMKRRIKNHDMHSSPLVRIPTPHFAVFYNGKGVRPETEIMRLSEAFEKAVDEPELELVCTVYNINPGREILQKCSVLREYTQFVETVRKYEEDEEEKPITKAIEYCIENHILEVFLKERGTEVIDAMTLDMTFERRMEIASENTERERKRADEAEKQIKVLTKQIETLTKQLEDIKQQNANKQ